MDLLVTFKLHFEFVTSYSLFFTGFTSFTCIESFDLFNNLACILFVFTCVLNQPFPAREYRGYEVFLFFSFAIMVRCFSGAVYMSPVCRDETLARLKIKKRNLAENIIADASVLIRTSNSCFIQQIFN